MTYRRRLGTGPTAPTTAAAGEPGRRRLPAEQLHDDEHQEHDAEEVPAPGRRALGHGGGAR